MHTNRNLSFNNLRPLEFKCSYLKCHKKDICDMVKVLYSRLPHKLSSWAFILSTRSLNIFDLHRRMCNTFFFGDHDISYTSKMFRSSFVVIQRTFWVKPAIKLLYPFLVYPSPSFFVHFKYPRESILLPNNIIFLALA